MRMIQAVLLLLCLVSLCSLSACKMTEAQMRSVSPELLSQDLSSPVLKSEPAAASAAEKTPQRLPLGLVFAGLALLVGAVIYLKADDVSPDRAAPRRKRAKRSSKSRKKS